MKHLTRIVACMLVLVLALTAGLTACKRNETGREKITMNGGMQLVPTPKSVSGGQTAYLYEATVEDSEPYRDAVDSFIAYAGRLGFRFTKASAEESDFCLSVDESLADGAYRLQAGGDGVVLTSAGASGFHHAFATLLQLLTAPNRSDNRSGDSDSDQSSAVYVPTCSIEDAPDRDYRGMMVDLARNWHDFSYLLEYVDMCYFYKVSVLHLHFTDDQSYTLPSELYPDLSTEGRHYTKEQIQELAEYAAARGVELMPEIDVPGHYTSFRSAYPRIFGANGIICQHAESIEAMRALFAELCDLFPHSHYIHIGGDEAAIMNWTTCGKCKKYAQSIGIDTNIADKQLLAQQMYANFIMQMAEVVFDKGRQPVVWEGFDKSVNDLVSKDILVMSWENYYQVTPDLLEGGFRILNCSWTPMYVVTPAPTWSTEEIYNWSIYQWQPVHPSSPYINTGLTIEPDDRVVGGQLLAWGDRIPGSFESVEEGVAAEQELLLERIPYLAENTWNVNKLSDYETVHAAAEALAARLRLVAGL